MSDWQTAPIIVPISLDAGNIYDRKKPSIATPSQNFERIFQSRVKPPEAALRALD
jgi:hypothetical protein